MKTAIVISDTHGNISAIEKILPLINENDYLIHLGDGLNDLRCFSRDIKANVFSVAGNCDGGGEDEILEIEKVKILITHGDKYGVKSSLYKLLMRAKEVGASVVFYGHTHQNDITIADGITLVNPGALNSFIERTYCYAIFHDGKCTVKNVPIR
mgnify:CR=1 FL=1